MLDKTQFTLSLGLFDTAVEAACAINDALAVERLSEQVLAKAKCKDNTLNCLYAGKSSSCNNRTSKTVDPNRRARSFWRERRRTKNGPSRPS